MWRGRLKNTKGEKFQMSCLGHASRRPPPAKPQPTAKNTAPYSPNARAGRLARPPTIAPVYGPAMRPARNAPSSVRSAASYCRSTRAVTPAASGSASPSANTRRSGQLRRSKIRMCRNRRYLASMVANAVITASLTMSVVSRNWPADKNLGSCSMAADDADDADDAHDPRASPRRVPNVEMVSFPP